MLNGMRGPASDTANDGTARVVSIVALDGRGDSALLELAASSRAV